MAEILKYMIVYWCTRRGSATSTALDLRSVGRGFKSCSTLRNNLGQVVHTYVPLSPSSITWYRPKGGDALRLGRYPQAWRKVMAAYRRVDDLRSPGADCLYTGISSEPNARYRVWESLYLYLYSCTVRFYCSKSSAY